MGQLLSHPLTEKTIIYNDYEHLSQQASRRRSSDHSSSANKHRAQKGAQFFNCVGSMQGYRLTQEDAHLVANCDSMMELNFYNPFTDREEMLSMSVFGVFDGHGGDECSKYVSSENDAYQGIRKWIRLSFETHEYGPVKGLESKSFKRRFRTIEGLVSQVLKDAFLLQDRELYCHYANSSCGSTGILAVIINEKSCMSPIPATRGVFFQRKVGALKLFRMITNHST